MLFCTTMKVSESYKNCSEYLKSCSLIVESISETQETETQNKVFQDLWENDAWNLT